MTTPDSKFGDGWIVTAQRRKGSTAKRHYLVALDCPEAAIAAAQAYLGEDYHVENGGRADAIHFKRRSMKNGDVFELGGRSGG